MSTAGRKPVSMEENAEAMLLREHVTGYAQNFLGLKYRYAGTSPKTGFDCYGFNEAMPGDLVFFGRKKGGIQHVAMVVENTEEGVFCVHSTSSRGIVVENISTSKYWAPKILFARDVISTQAN